MMQPTEKVSKAKTTDEKVSLESDLQMKAQFWTRLG